MTYSAFLGDKEHDFALTPAMIVELERVTGLGIGALFKTLMASTFGFRHVVETIRLALIGGGMQPEQAASFVKTYVETRPLAETFPVALGILETVWFGAAKDVGDVIAAEQVAMTAFLQEGDA